MFVYPTEVREEAKRLRGQGASLREIAEALGISLSTARDWVAGVLKPVPAVQDAPQSAESFQAGALKICPRCMRILPDDAFNRLGDGRQGWCRECFSVYFQERGQLHRDQTQAAKRERVVAARVAVEDHFALHACIDCGIDDRIVLEFDHIGTKRGNVSTLSWNGLSQVAVVKEMAECEVVCVNCHRRRTAHRAGYWRTDPASMTESSRFGHGRSRNRRFVYELLKSSSCFDCGLDDLLVLEFDHMCEKEASISGLVAGGYSLERLRAEVAKCAIRCANCHRRQTLHRQRHAPGRS